MADIKENTSIAPSTLSFDVEMTQEELTKAIEKWRSPIDGEDSRSEGE
jgi:hypothetical protein